MNTKAQLTCLNLSLSFLQEMHDSEARFRNLVTIGTLLKMENSNKNEAEKLNVKDIVEATKMLDQTDKVLKCADALLKLF